MTQPCPTADEVARIVVAAFRMVGSDPLKITTQMPHGRPPEYLQRVCQARGYAALAIHKLFPSLTGGQISRMVGAPNNYAQDLFRDIRRGKLRWYDETDFRAILALCRVDQRAPSQIVVDETVRSYEMPAPYSARFGSKRRLEDELRQAVENTARMQRAEEGEAQ